MTANGRALTVLAVNTVAFTVCFAAWTLNGVLVTYLVDNGAFAWTESQIGWLIGLPVLTGSLARLPLGILTDKYGGRRVFGLLLFLAAIASSTALATDPATFFTDNVTPMVTGVTPLEQALLGWLNGATASIDAAIYDFDRVSLRDALLAGWVVVREEVGN